MDQQPTYHRINYYIFLLSFVGLLFSSNSSANNFILTPNHTSTYQLEKYGMNLGKMVNQLNYKDGIITYTSIATAKGMATMFISSEPTETSILEWPENKHHVLPQPKSYRYIQEAGHKKNQQFDFITLLDHRVKVQGRYKFKDYNLESDKILWSRQMLPLLMSSDLLNDEKTKTNIFYITNKGNIDPFTYHFEKIETIKFNNEKIETLKFKITKPKKSRVTYVWLSKQYYYIPLKIEQYKKGELSARLTMTDFTLQ